MVVPLEYKKTLLTTLGIPKVLGRLFQEPGTEIEFFFFSYQGGSKSVVLFLLWSSLWDQAVTRLQLGPQSGFALSSALCCSPHFLLGFS